jgi:hypothetical protein
MKRKAVPRKNNAYANALAAVGALSRDEMTKLVNAGKLLYRQACALVTAQVPEDVWLLMLDQWNRKLSRLCVMACVSRAWDARITGYIRAHRADQIAMDKRIMLKFPELQTLTLDRRAEISNKTLAQMTNLSSLRLDGIETIVNKGVLPLKRLQRLELVGKMKGITNEAVRDQIQLCALALVGTNKRLTDSMFGKLARLTSLDLCGNDHISDRPLKAMWSLRHLGLAHNKKITNAGIRHMRGGLTSLDLRENSNITGDALRWMTQLSCLNLSRNNTITSSSLDALAPRMERLWLTENGQIHAFTLMEMTNLRALCLYGNTQIQGWAVARLTRLETLVMPTDATFRATELAPLVNLRYLAVTCRHALEPSVVDTLREMTRLEHLGLHNYGQLHALKGLAASRPKLEIETSKIQQVLNDWRVL